MGSPACVFVSFKILDPRAVAPTYKTDGAAAMDLTAITNAWLSPGDMHEVRTGLAVAIPAGYEGQIRPRSGLARDWRVTVLNAPGTIDADYRGEIIVLLVNHACPGAPPLLIEPGMRIAQLVIAPVTRAVVTLTDELPSTARGEGGFGSTGR